MRRVRLLFASLCLLGPLAGCCTFQHTAGVCDCYPPPVEELLKLPAGTFCNGHFTPSPTAAPMPPMTNATPAPPMGQVPGNEAIPLPREVKPGR